jgi:peptide-methionine (S)-S-oxide reductase
VSIFSRHKSALVEPEQLLPGRSERMFPIAARHKVLDAPVVTDDVPEGYEVAVFGLGCFWGAEEIYWKTPGVWSTSVGYAGGTTPNPSYEEVCSGGTGHTEVVRVFFDPAKVRYDELLRVFWEGHDPTQGMRQGNDVGTQYRSAAYYFDEAQRAAIEVSRAAYQERLRAAGYAEITTDVQPAPTFYFAESYHQQYLAKNPGGYCGHGGTGVSCPIGLATSPQ